MRSIIFLIIAEMEINHDLDLNFNLTILFAKKENNSPNMKIASCIVSYFLTANFCGNWSLNYLLFGYFYLTAVSF